MAVSDDIIRQYITEAVKTWRKRAAAMVLATQSSDDLERAEMLSVIAESCATKKFLANPGMDREAYRETFTSMKPRHRAHRRGWFPSSRFSSSGRTSANR
jgi:type IV secretory pathway VirB4 component